MEFTTVHCCGSGSTGLLFQPCNNDYPCLKTLTFPYRLLMISTSGTISASIDSNENCYIWKDNIYTLALRNVVQVSCGWTHVLILTSDKVFVYGQGNHGQLGLGSICEAKVPESLNICGAVNISCGFRTSFVLVNDGFYAFGENSGYQLGFAHKEQVRIPIKNDRLGGLESIRSGNKHTLGFCQNELFVWGTNNFGQLGSKEKIQASPRRFDFLGKIKKICCGWNHSVILLDNGVLLMAGKGKMGQQGNGKNEDQFEFTEIIQQVDDVESGTENVFVIKHGDLFAWGWNEHGNLATGDKLDRNIPTKVLSGVRKVFCGGAVSYFI